MKQKALCNWIGVFLIALLISGCSNQDILNEVPNDFGIEYLQSEESENEEIVQISEEPAGSTEVSAPSDNDGINYLLPSVNYEYARQFLSEAEQIWYCDIKDALASMTETVKLNERGLELGLDDSYIDRVFQCVLSDHPELFYVDGYHYTYYTQNDQLVSIEFMGSYTIEEATARERAGEIENAVQEILAGVSPDMDEYEKVKYVYETIILNTDYDLNSAENQNMYSVLVNHASVCQGYAKATQYLLSRMGMECTFVTGSVINGENHSWNVVKIDGESYYLDTTWGDPSYQSEGDSDSGAYRPSINYDYLNITTEELLRTHRINSHVPMPECVATDANYFRREGCFIQDYDLGQIQEMYRKVQQEGNKGLSVKCSDEECYNTLFSNLINNQDIFTVIGMSDGSVAYSTNDSQLTLTFWMTSS